MKALSVRQPWAWAILHAGKRIENRDWRACHYRGPLLIHAAKGCTRDEWLAAADWMHANEVVQGDVPDLVNLERGGVVGVCDVIGMMARDGGTTTHPTSLDRRWHERGSLGIMLANVRPLPFVPFKGSLGFFNVPDSLVPAALKPC